MSGTQCLVQIVWYKWSGTKGLVQIVYKKVSLKINDSNPYQLKGSHEIQVLNPKPYEGGPCMNSSNAIQ